MKRKMGSVFPMEWKDQALRRALTVAARHNRDQQVVFGVFLSPSSGTLAGMTFPYFSKRLEPRWGLTISKGLVILLSGQVMCGRP